METNKKNEFFGKLHEVDSLLGIAEKTIATLWESGSIRFLPDDLDLMRKLDKEIRKKMNRIMSFNHGKFSKILNSVIDPKVETKIIKK